MSGHNIKDSERLRSEFSRAKGLGRNAFALQILLVAAPLTTVLFPGPPVRTVVSLLALLGGAALFFLRSAAGRAYAAAERLRRMQLLANALGHEPDVNSAMSVIVASSPTLSKDKEPMGAYYNSDLPQGPRRLLHLLWESAHCTQYTSAKAAQYAGAFTVVGGVFVVAGFVFGLQQGFGATLGAKISAIGIVLSGIVGLGAFAELWRQYSALSHAAKDVSASCSALLKRGSEDLVEAVAVLEDYDVALGRALPIPSFVWHNLQEKLAASWELARAQVRT